MHNSKHQCHMAANCTYHLSSPSCSKRAIQQQLNNLLTKIRIFSGEKKGLVIRCTVCISTNYSVQTVPYKQHTCITVMFMFFTTSARLNNTIHSI